MRQFFFVILLLSILSCSKKTPETLETEQPKDSTTSISPADTISRNREATVDKTIPDSTFLIVPGKSIGQISLGETAEKINNTLGKADSGDAAMGKALAFWYSRQHKQNYVAVYFVRDNVAGTENMFAQQIRVNSPSFKTIESIGPGSRIAQIRQNHAIQPIAYYTNPEQQRIYIFDDTAAGIAFEVSVPDSMCTAITIHQKGENMTNSYLPVHPDMVRLHK